MSQDCDMLLPEPASSRGGESGLAERPSTVDNHAEAQWRAGERQRMCDSGVAQDSEGQRGRGRSSGGNDLTWARWLAAVSR